jgi:protein SCO1/2
VPALRTLLASLLILAVGTALLAAATDGFRAFTSEAARRLAVAEQPRPVPAVVLQTSRGEALPLDALRGRWLLVDFVYTRCRTYCSAQGSAFAQLQDQLAPAIARGQAALLSISFDPARDTADELAAYLARSRDRGAGWYAARPTSEADLQALQQAFGVTVIPDGLGGYEHNAAILVVDPQGRLVAVLDWDAPQDALQYLQARLS